MPRVTASVYVMNTSMVIYPTCAMLVTVCRPAGEAAGVVGRREDVMSVSANTAQDGGVPVGAENPVTSCDLHVLVYETAEPVSSQRPDGRGGRRGSAAGGRLLSE